MRHNPGALSGLGREGVRSVSRAKNGPAVGSLVTRGSGLAQVSCVVSVAWRVWPGESLVCGVPCVCCRVVCSVCRV